ncbi:MAG: hypothetical protein E7665_02020 [Ruminococcaceae bacterium]|nr:hypothetical protein [Oscillospiraceae bacterium]
MSYRNLVSLFLSLCLLICMTSCGKEEKITGKTDENVFTEAQGSTENEDTADETAVSTEEEKTEDTTTGEKNTEDVYEFSFLSPEKSFFTYFEWADGLDGALVHSTHSFVKLNKTDAENYPEMAKLLSDNAVMQEKAMLEEFDNLVSIAGDEFEKNKQSFDTYVSSLNVLVRRADSIAVSLLWDSYSDYGNIENYRVFHGSNYDTKSGKELRLTDVVKSVNNDLAKAVEKELLSHTWTGELKSKDAVENFFAEAPYDISNWTVDYNGVTFYFAPGELCNEGMMTATVSFSEYPELFHEKYMNVPKEYAVELPQDISFFTELDDDGALDQISVSGAYDEERNKYTDHGVYTDKDGNSCIDDCFAYDLHPYYVRSEGGNYIYLFRQDFEEGVRLMSLVVYKLNEDGTVVNAGEADMSPAQYGDNIFLVLNDPENFILDDIGNETEKASFRIGGDGIPVKK